MLTVVREIEKKRLRIASKTPASKKSALGQFMTAETIASFMTGLFSNMNGREIRLIDPGAGVGSLTTAFTRKAVSDGASSLSVTAWEIDSELVPHLEETLEYLCVECQKAGVKFCHTIEPKDFIGAVTRNVELLEVPCYTHAILNPPYKKINAKSDQRLALRTAKIETGNLYSAFVTLSLLLLDDGGELVAITPRSFCNGPYFRLFRKLLLRKAALTHAHVFESRTQAFKMDDVLQENVIFRLVKGAMQGDVTMSTSTDGNFADLRQRLVPFKEVVLADDNEAIIHLVAEEDTDALKEMARFSNTLEDLGLGISTGPVVDFRLSQHLFHERRNGSVPLIYPLHFENGYVAHPKVAAKKANWIAVNDDTNKWLMPSGYYTVVRRLSSKEERRRIVPAIFDPTSIPCEQVGFENHLNVFHRNKHGLPPEIARGLAVWLGSTIADKWLRRFSGHTQVNASDLRALRYPDLETLSAWGHAIDVSLPSQETIDAIVDGQY